MDFEGLRPFGVDYISLDKESVPHYEYYQDVYANSDPRTNHVVNTQSSEEKRLLKLEVNRIRMAERRANETTQERALRLYKNKMRNKIRRATETPEQRADRNRRNMERNRERRNKQRSVPECNNAQVPEARPANPPRVRYYINDLLKVELTPSPPNNLHNISTPEFANR